MNTRQIFLRHVAQTSPAPVGLHIVSASGNELCDAAGRRYLDLIGGISVCNVGHGRPEVVEAVQRQAAAYMHIMVYGELVQTPQVAYAALLSRHLPEPLSSVYFTNSGTEATEGAIKLARRVTGKTDMVAARSSYHGSTLGALSVMGDEYWRNAFRPLLPGVWHGIYNDPEFLDRIGEDTACVLLETVQAEAGVCIPDPSWMEAVRKRCSETGALLILDEIQCGFGRTGRLWGFEHFNIVPDILLLGKALGGGMPLGAFIASAAHMRQLTHDPVLGHITTFGGHPVSCAAGMAALEVLLKEPYIQQVQEKEQLFRKYLKHPRIREVRSFGLLLAIELQSNEEVLRVLGRCLEEGVFSDWFLFAPHCIRIAPPLTITEAEIRRACAVFVHALD